MHDIFLDSLSNSLVHHHKRLNANKLNKIAVVNLTLNNFEDIAFKDRDLSITMESVHNRTDDSYSNRIMVNFNARKPSKDLPILESGGKLNENNLFVYIYMC